MSEEDIFKLLGDRLALSRLKKAQQAVKQQKILDNATRHAQYTGFQVNGGALIQTTGGNATKSLITNGLILPGAGVRITGDTADQRPTYSAPKEEKKKVSFYLDVIKEVIGDLEPSKFEISLERNKKKVIIVARQEIATKKEEGINTAFVRVPFNSVKQDYIVTEENQNGYYLSYFVSQLLSWSQPKGKAKSYLCNCQPKIIYKFISRKGFKNDLSAFFRNPQTHLARTKCEDLQDLLDPKLNDKEKKAELEKCKTSIQWRLIEVGASGVGGGIIYAEGLVAEDGKLLLPYSVNPTTSATLKTEPSTKSAIFLSTYDYYGYMQIQLGCSFEDKIYWKVSPSK